MKKLICVFCAAAVLFAFAACGKKEGTASPVDPATTVKEQYIDADVGKNLEKTVLARTEKQTYYLTILSGKQVLCRTDLQERLKVLLTFGDNTPTFYPETFERSGQTMLYYSYRSEGDETASLYVFNLASERATKVIGSPCSEFILLNLPDTFEMYAYGFIADVGGMKVINLKSGAASKQYSMTVGQMKIFFVDPDSHPAVLFGRNLTTTISDMGDRTHIRIDTVERKSNGDVKTKWSVSFSPALSVAREIDEE